MASIITLKSEALSDAAVKAEKLKADMDSIYAQLGKLENRLGSEINALSRDARVSGNWGVASQKKNLLGQANCMGQMASLLNAASSETGLSSNKLKGSMNQLQLSVRAMKAPEEIAGAAVKKVLASGLAISSVFNMKGFSDVWTELQRFWDTMTGKAMEAETAKAEISKNEAAGAQNSPKSKAATTETGTKETEAAKAQKNPEKSEEQLLSEMKARYKTALKMRNKNATSLKGQCSAFTYRQLVDLGVFKDNVDSPVGAGKDYYAVWGKKSKTSTGYKIEACGGKNGLKDLLAAHPNENLKNIVLSFNYDGKNYQDPAGAGHVLLITEIRNGKVYFMESNKMETYNLKTRKVYKEGEPIVLSVSDFLKQYPGMNGAVHFYK